MFIFLGFVLLVFFLMMSAFWSASEIALNSLSKYRVKKLIVLKKSMAKPLLRWLNSPYYLLTVILTGNVFSDMMVSFLSGWLAVTIFVACKGKNPTGSREIADRAREALNDPQHEGYNLITKNCHQFCHYCLTGKIDNGIDDFTFTALEDEMMRIQGMDTWRRWEFE